jgi:hypothetical protein
MRTLTNDLAELICQDALRAYRVRFANLGFTKELFAGWLSRIGCIKLESKPNRLKADLCSRNANPDE